MNLSSGLIIVVRRSPHFSLRHQDLFCGPLRLLQASLLHDGLRLHEIAIGLDEGSEELRARGSSRLPHLKQIRRSLPFRAIAGQRLPLRPVRQGGDTLCSRIRACNRLHVVGDLAAFICSFFSRRRRFIRQLLQPPSLLQRYTNTKPSYTC